MLIATFDFALLLLFHLQLSLEFQRSLAERELTLWRCSELLSEWFGSVARVFMSKNLPKYCPEEVTPLRQLLGLTVIGASQKSASLSIPSSDEIHAHAMTDDA